MQFYPIGTRVKFVGGDRFAGNVSWPDGDRLEVGDVGVVAEIDVDEQFAYAVHFSGAFVRLGFEDMVACGEGSPVEAGVVLQQQQQQPQRGMAEEVSHALSDARLQLETINTALSKAASPRGGSVLKPGPSPLEEELQRMRVQHSRVVEEYERKVAMLERRNDELEEMVVELKEEAAKDRDTAATRSKQVLELENEVGRYQKDTFDMQETIARLQQDLSAHEMSIPPPTLPPLHIGMSVDIAEGPCTLLEPYSGTDPSFQKRKSWWVRLSNGEERLRTPSEMHPATAPTPQSRTSPPPPPIAYNPPSPSPYTPPVPVPSYSTLPRRGVAK